MIEAAFTVAAVAGLTVAFVAVLALIAWRWYLDRPAKDIVQMKADIVRARELAHTAHKELEAACGQWGVKLAHEQARTAALEKVIDKLEPGTRKNPLGSQYTTRS